MNRSDRGLFTKKYGQVILKNPKVARFEVSSIALSPGSMVLEIGPGPGTLTTLLLETGYKVTAVESDHRFYEELEAKFHDDISQGNLILQKGDFLEMDGGKYDAIIGNVPYHISSPIVFKLAEFTFSKAILMFQREFCHRMVAKYGSKDYSRLSVNAQLRYRLRIIANVSRNSFFPPPEVDSSVMEITPRNEFREKDILRADSVFKLLFSAKRKKISTVLKKIEGEDGEKRVGEISPEELLRISLDYLTR